MSEKGYSNKKEGYDKKTYSEKQQYVLDNVITKYGGDAVAAAKGAGYTNPYQAIEALSEELIELANRVLARYSIPAAMTLGNIMTSDEPVIQANEKIRSAEKILERTIPKQEKVDHNVTASGGIFVLPDKKPVGSNE